MKSEPQPVLEKLLKSEADPNSTAVREIVQEVTERVLRNLTPAQERFYSAFRSESSRK